jgi:hypothetical protein
VPHRNHILIKTTWIQQLFSVHADPPYTVFLLCVCNTYSRVPIIWPSVNQQSISTNMPWWNVVPFYQQPTQPVTERIILPQPHTSYILCTQLQLLLTCYCSDAGMILSKRNGRRLRSKYPLLISSENTIFHLQIYITLNTIFVHEIFSFDAVLHFLCNLKIS